MLGTQRLTQQRIIQQVDLTNGQVIRRAPPRMQLLQLLTIQRTLNVIKRLRVGAMVRPVPCSSASADVSPPIGPVLSLLTRESYPDIGARPIRKTLIREITQ